MFAKLFENETIGQILVKLDQSDSESHTGPEIRYYFQAPSFGICSVAAFYNDSSAGWDAADTAFANVTQLSAEKIALGAVNRIISELEEEG